MPIYEYECTKCKVSFEVKVKSHKSPKPDCPECGEKDPKKKISVSGFVLKGSGWARDGYS
jgi:putative FmdB family regulatory protein